MSDSYKKFGRKYERKRPLERPKRRYKDNIKIGLKKILSEDVDWIYLAALSSGGLLRTL
jgi:hypothetical protein